MTGERPSAAAAFDAAQGTGGTKIVGKVTPEERDQVRALFEHKNGLAELFRSLSGLSKEELENSPLYDRIVRDMGESSVKFQRWWDGTSRRYGWENIAGWKWEIDFETCVVSIRHQ
jgi:CXXX repeat modification system protein